MIESESDCRVLSCVHQVGCQLLQLAGSSSCCSGANPAWCWPTLRLLCSPVNIIPGESSLISTELPRPPPLLHTQRPSAWLAMTMTSCMSMRIGHCTSQHALPASASCSGPRSFPAGVLCTEHEQTLKLAITMSPWVPTLCCTCAGRPLIMHRQQRHGQLCAVKKDQNSSGVSYGRGWYEQTRNPTQGRTVREELGEAATSRTATVTRERSNARAS